MTMQQDTYGSLVPLTPEQIIAQIKETRRLIAERYQEITRLEHELHALEDAQLARAPRGTYRHHREDGPDIAVEAAVLETDGDAKRIQYQIPQWQARRGEEDAYIRWLRSPEELARFTPRDQPA
ncbi:MAG: hypothetical protein ACYDER_07725 [Ktedonobacteraceae bacterium]